VAPRSRTPDAAGLGRRIWDHVAAGLALRRRSSRPTPRDEVTGWLWEGPFATLIREAIPGIADTDLRRACEYLNACGMVVPGQRPATPGQTSGSAPGVERIRALMRRIGGRVLVLDDRLSPRAPPGLCRRIRSIRRLLAPAAPRLCHAPSLGIIRPAMLLVGFQPLTDLECSVHVELPVHALLPWLEVGGRPRHWDYLGPVDLVGVPIVNNGRRAFVEDVLQPIGVRAGTDAQ
jgi:hypothetical protein